MCALPSFQRATPFRGTRPEYRRRSTRVKRFFDLPLPTLASLGGYDWRDRHPLNASRRRTRIYGSSARAVKPERQHGLTTRRHSWTPLRASVTAVSRPRSARSAPRPTESTKASPGLQPRASPASTHHAVPLAPRAGAGAARPRSSTAPGRPRPAARAACGGPGASVTTGISAGACRCLVDAAPFRLRRLGRRRAVEVRRPAGRPGRSWSPWARPRLRSASICVRARGR